MSVSSTTSSTTSLSDEEIAKIAKWADSGAPRGDPADMPPPMPLRGSATWTAGEPDLITVTNEMLVEGDAADWWGDIESIKVGNTEDLYVKSVEIREINDVLDHQDIGAGRKTVGGRFVVHHMIWSTKVINEDGSIGESTGWPVHEVGRNADVFDPEGARLLPANSSVVSDSVHLHSNGIDTSGPSRDRLAVPSPRTTEDRNTRARCVPSATPSTSTSNRWRRTKNCTRICLPLTLG